MKSLLALFTSLVSIFAMIPLYLDYYSRSYYYYTFSCAAIQFGSAATILSGTFYDFVAIHTRCDFSNIGHRTVSLKTIETFGVWEDGYILIFDRPDHGSYVHERFHLPTQPPYAVALEKRSFLTIFF
jgi:hypothetical protein